MAVDSNNHLRVEYLRAYFDDHCRMHPIDGCELQIYDIIELCKHDEYLKSMYCIYNLEEMLTTQNKSKVDILHKNLLQFSEVYRNLVGLDDISNIMVYLQELQNKYNYVDFLSLVCKIIIHNFTTSGAHTQVIILKTIHYFVFTIYREDDCINVYITDSTYLNGKSLKRGLQPFVNNIILPKLTRQKDGYTCSIFALLDVKIIWQYLAEDKLLLYIYAKTFPPEMMTYCQDNEVFTWYMHNICSDHKIKEIYDGHIVDGKNTHCADVLHSIKMIEK